MARDKLDETRKVQKPPVEDVLSVRRKREWLPWEKGDVPCEICGLLCPLECYEGYDRVHLTCVQTVQGRTWLREYKKKLKAEILARSSLGL